MRKRNDDAGRDEGRREPRAGMRRIHEERQALGLVGRRVRLRPLTEEDDAILYQWVSDPHEACLWRGNRGMPTFEDFRAEQQEKLPFEAQHMVIEGRETGAPIGWIFAYELMPLERCCLFTVYVAPQARVFGAAAEATVLFLDYLFTYFSLNKVAAEIFEYNRASLRLARHLGFLEEGRLRQQRAFDGQLWDVLRLGLLRAEWDVVRQRFVSVSPAFRRRVAGHAGRHG